MSHNQTTWHLPTEVETDSRPTNQESRVPLLGLHMTSHPVNSDVIPGSIDQVDSLCDSGLGSFSSGGFSLQNSLSHEYDHTLEKFHNLSMTSNCPRSNMKLGTVPCNSVGYSSIYDDGFESADHLLSETKPDHCWNNPSHGETLQNLDIMKQIFTRDEDGDTQLHMAIIHGYSDVALHMIEITPSQEYLNIQNNLRQTPLHLATCTGQTLVVRKLVSRGAQVDVQDHHGNTPLHIASRFGNAECVRAITQPISNQESKDCPYHSTFQKLPQNPEIKNYEGQTCLHLAAAQGNLEVMVYLISAKVGADVNAPDGRSGRTILHHAIESKCIPTLALLLRITSVDVNAKTYNSDTPLQLAQSCGSNDIVRALLARGAQVGPMRGVSDCDSSLGDSEEESMDV